MLRQRLIGPIPWLFSGVALGAAYWPPFSPYHAGLAWLFALTFAALFRRAERPSHVQLLTFGVTLYLASCYWLIEVVAVYVEVSTFVGFLLVLAGVAVASLQFVLLNLLFRGLAKWQLLARWELALPMAWCAAELLTPKVLPWTLGNSQMPFLNLVQIADLGGISLVSFLMLWWAGLFLQLVAAVSSRQTLGAALRRALVGAAVLAFVLAYGSNRIYAMMRLQEPLEALSLGLVQASLDPLEDFAAEKRADNLALHQAMSNRFLAEVQPDLLIWPETVVGFDMVSGQTKVERGPERDPYPGLRVPLIFGGQTRSREHKGAKPGYYNSAHLLYPSGERRALLQAGAFSVFQRMPLSRTFPILNEIFPKSFTLLSGENEKPFQVRLPRYRTDKPVSIAAAICYEDMESNVFRAMVANHGAEVLLALTSDDWFLDNIAALQHHYLASARAIELRRSLVRATGDGITGVVAPDGSTIEALPPFRRGVLHSVQARPLSVLTPYARWGSFLEKGGIAVALLFAATGYFRRKRAM